MKKIQFKILYLYGKCANIRS